MHKTRTVGQKWLANEHDLHLSKLKKCTKGQSNRSILSKVIVLTNYKSTDTDRQAYSRKTFIRVQRVSKFGHLTKTRGGGPLPHILHKSNTFSDENVKMLRHKIIRFKKIYKFCFDHFFDKMHSFCYNRDKYY